MAQNLIAAVVAANRIRRGLAAADIMVRQPRVVGTHRLLMEAGSDDGRQSAVRGIMTRLKAEGVEGVISEPVMTEERFLDRW